ncbi:hypothetical protein SLS56_009418 [Neofusicoccum ribis]|uniref:CCHC-type domain-containing protein n=1 Tax=Neofusicoccum ribis TaxID=45134 RepID=A0ABR3SHV4_9PEZI
MEDDSRTATLGRKRQREPQDDQPDADVATPDKKVKMGDDDESDYSPSLGPQNQPSRERPDSPSLLDVDFPHMSTASETAAKASQLSTAQKKAEESAPPAQVTPVVPPPEDGADFISLAVDDDELDGGDDDDSETGSVASHSDGGSEEGERGESDKTSAAGGHTSQAQTPPGTRSGSIKLTKTQRKLVRKFENLRAEKIIDAKLARFWSLEKGFHAKGHAAALVTMDIPQGPSKNNKKKLTNTIAKDSIWKSFITLLTTHQPQGLVGLFSDKEDASPSFNQLVVYRKQEQIDALAHKVTETPISLQLRNGKAEFFFLSIRPLEQSKQLQFKDNQTAKKKGKARTVLVNHLAAGLAEYVQTLLESGGLDPDMYEGFNPEAAQGLKQKAAGEEIGAGLLKADPKFARDHLENPDEAKSKQSQTASKSGSAASTKPSTPASESQDKDASSGEEGEITSAANNTPPSQDAMDVEISNGQPHSEAQQLAQVPNGQPRTTLAHLSEHERMLQTRYWGLGKDDDPVRCMKCDEFGHMEEICPLRVCHHCQAVDEHFYYNCPIVAKCTKCRERGHKKESCPSKLARTAGDGFFCDICSEPGHVEEECQWIWRTYNPNKMANIKKVARLAVSCYQCGANTHFGNDCPMRPRKGDQIINDTWSAKEANKYLIDPEAFWAELKQQTSNGQGLSIKGRAQNQHIHFSSSEDDGDIDNFYRNKRSSNNTAPSRGNIRINAGAGTRGGRFSQQNTSRRRGSIDNQSYGGSNYGDYRQGNNNFEPINRGWQPPLPKEPPPPLPPAPPRGGFGGGRGRGRGRGGGGGGGNHMSLPPRPQPPVAPARKQHRGRGGKK